MQAWQVALTPFVLIGLVATRALGRWKGRLDLGEVQEQLGPRSTRHMVFLLGAWREEETNR